MEYSLKSIVIIILYFGRLPQWFELWLESCKYNPTIDFIIYTDDKTGYEFPENVKPRYIGFEEMKSCIQKCFDFTVNIDSPYKLCDFKQAYGYIFEEEMVEYDFWGHCDLDQVMGDLRSFLTNEVLEAHEKIYRLGHLAVYRNTPRINRLFQEPGWKDWRHILSTPYIYAFDETGMHVLSKKHGVRAYDKVECIDVAGHPGYIMPRKGVASYRHQAFYWENGKVFQCCLIKNEVHLIEHAYIHFQKRKLHYTSPMTGGFYITATRFLEKPVTGPPTAGEICSVNHYPGVLNMAAWRVKNRMQRIYGRITGKLKKIIYDIWHYAG